MTSSSSTIRTFGTVSLSSARRGLRVAGRCRDGEGVVNEERAQALVADCRDAVVVLDGERRVVAASARAESELDGLERGLRLSEEAAAEHPAVLVLFLDAPPELSAYQEL